MQVSSLRDAPSRRATVQFARGNDLREERVLAADIDTKERVRQALSIIDVVQGYGHDMRRQGRNFVCRCPWHDDRSPSLTINAERQSWKCWVCNIGGDVFSFVMQQEKVDFREALRILAEKANIPLTNQTSTPVVPGSVNDKKTLYDAMAWASQMFQDCLKSDIAEPARKYLAERGISSDSIARFNIGFSPNEWTWLLERARFTQFSPEILEACGVLVRGANSGKLFDFFRGRVIFPIHDLQKRTVAFGARVLPEFAEQLRGKYINTAETRLFTKSEHLYAIDEAREATKETKNITVVEGYTDVVMAHQFGVRDVVAVLGTALGPRHIQNLKRFADSITLVLDGDEAGKRRASEVLELFIAAQVNVQIVTLPEEFDPCEFFLERGADAWREAMTTAVDALEHKIRLVTKGVDLLRDTHRASQALEDILGTLAKAPAQSLGSAEPSPLREQQIIARLAREFRISDVVVRDRLKDLRKKASARTSTLANPQSDQATYPANDSTFIPVEKIRAASLDPRERELLELLCTHPGLAPTALEELSLDDLLSSAARDIFTTYREMEEQGRELDFGAVLSNLPSEPLKSLFVEIDERAADRDAKATQDAATRLRGVIDALRKHEKERIMQNHIAVLEEQRLEHDQEMDLFKELLEINRRRMGIHPK